MILRRIPTWAWLATIVVVSVVFRGVIVRGILAPFIVVDEILWSEVARGLADSGQPLVRDTPDPGLGIIYPLVIAPAFVDPHVHLRTPGREDEETLRSGTEAAAAGGYCAILAMPNTEPIVDSAAALGSLVETARAEAEVPLGFLAAITKGQAGSELTEMGELADAGAAGFTDDGVPVASPGLMRRALLAAESAGDREVQALADAALLDRTTV